MKIKISKKGVKISIALKPFETYRVIDKLGYSKNELETLLGEFLDGKETENTGREERTEENDNII